MLSGPAWPEPPSFDRRCTWSGSRNMVRECFVELIFMKQACSKYKDVYLKYSLNSCSVFKPSSLIDEAITFVLIFAEGFEIIRIRFSVF